MTHSNDEPYEDDFDDGTPSDVTGSLIDDLKKKPKGKSKSSSKIAPRCYESHPPYEVAPGIMIYGGSCSWPIVKDADIYGGFDGGMHMQTGHYPWEKQDGPVEFLFKITDMNAPKEPAEFKKMIEWLAEQLVAGKKVHLGCIGGHGRTGTVLAALRKHMTGDEDAAQHVRTNYCKKAVESSSQIKFLKEHWGINEVKPTKTFAYSSSQVGSSKGNYGFDFKEMGTPKTFDYSTTKNVSGRVSTGMPLSSANSIWGE